MVYINIILILEKLLCLLSSYSVVIVIVIFNKYWIVNLKLINFYFLDNGYVYLEMVVMILY